MTELTLTPRQILQQNPQVAQQLFTAGIGTAKVMTPAATASTFGN